MTSVHEAMQRNAEERQQQYNQVVAEARRADRATLVHVELAMAWKDCQRAARIADAEGADRLVIEEYNYGEWSSWAWGRHPEGRAYRLGHANEDPPWALATVPRLDKDVEEWAQEALYKLEERGALHFVTADDIDHLLYSMGRGEAAPVAEAYVERLQAE